MRQWKLSPTDLESRRRWYEYSLARDEMLEATDTDFAPWHLVHSDDKKRARLNIISHLLRQFPYEEIKREKVKMPDRSEKHAYDDQATLKRPPLDQATLLRPSMKHGRGFGPQPRVPSQLRCPSTNVEGAANSRLCHHEPIRALTHTEPSLSLSY